MGITLLFAKSASASIEIFKARWIEIEQGSEAWFEPSLQGSPLLAELHIAALSQASELPDANTRSQVLRDYAQHVSLRGLRAHWIDLAQAQNAFDVVQTLYRSDTGQASECAWRLGRALKGLNEQQAAHRAYVEDAQAGACQRLIKEGIERGWIGAWSHSERVTRLLSQGRYTSALELAATLGPKNLARAQAYIQSRQDPQAYVLEHPNGPWRKDAIKRLIDLDPWGSEQWIRADETELREWRSVHLILDNHPQTGLALSQLKRPLQSRSLREWEIRHYLRQQDYDRVAERIDELPASLATLPIWQFWRAQAHDQLGQPDQARSKWQQIDRQLDYYGFLAADRLGIEYPRLRPSHRDEDSVSALLKQPGVQIAKALFDAGLDSRARSQWRAGFAGFDLSEKQAATELAQRWGWASEEVRGAVNSRQTDTVHMYPDALRPLMQNRAIDEDWLLGLTRTESLFQVDVRSRAGALGLMQLMPTTGERQAQQLELPWQGSASLLDPQFNIELGSDYLHRMYQRFGEHPLLATAAYNAGPNALARWLTDPQLPPEIWVETIGFKETRQYVKKVMFAATLYNQALGGRDRRLSDRMLPLPVNDGSL